MPSLDKLQCYLIWRRESTTLRKRSVAEPRRPARRRHAHHSTIGRGRAPVGRGAARPETRRRNARHGPGVGGAGARPCAEPPHAQPRSAQLRERLGKLPPDFAAKRQCATACPAGKQCSERRGTASAEAVAHRIRGKPQLRTRAHSVRLCRGRATPGFDARLARSERQRHGEDLRRRSAGHQGGEQHLLRRHHGRRGGECKCPWCSAGTVATATEEACASVL